MPSASSGTGTPFTNSGLLVPDETQRLAEADGDKATGAQRQTIDAELEKLRASDEYSAWSVTRPERGFHDPERFGYVQFIAPATAPSRKEMR